MSVKLIINADDFGYTESVNEGIALAFSRGVVTSTSLMPNQEAVSHALTLVRDRIVPAAGVHLVLTAGKPLCAPEKVPSLVDGGGNFISRGDFFQRDLNLSDVIAEFTLQVMKVMEAGREVTHLDTHHHVHMHPVVFEAIAEIAVKFGLPVRSINDEMRDKLRKKQVATPGYFIGEWFDENVSLNNLMKYLKKSLQSEARVVELMTHPGLVDDRLSKKSSYLGERQEELDILCIKGIRDKIRNMGFNLCRYSILR